QPRGLQRLVPLDTDLAPDAALTPRREADGVGVIAERFADAVDPAETQRLVPCLRPVDRRLAATLLPETDEQFGRGGVISVKPSAEVGLSGEEGGPFSLLCHIG